MRKKKAATVKLEDLSEEQRKIFLARLVELGGSVDIAKAVHVYEFPTKLVKFKRWLHRTFPDRLLKDCMTATNYSKWSGDEQ